MNRAEVIGALSTSFHVSRETIDALDAFVDLVLQENKRQNLISRASEGEIWDRHILDSAQLLPHCREDAPTWLDVGAGAGFPGVVMALLTNKQFTLLEPRRRRADFLKSAAQCLGIGSRVSVMQTSVQSFTGLAFATISGRAVTRLNEMLIRTNHLGGGATTWLLHKGPTASEEVSQAKRNWHADFELLPSLTSADASIVRITRLQLRPVA